MLLPTEIGDATQQEYRSNDTRVIVNTNKRKRWWTLIPNFDASRRESNKRRRLNREWCAASYEFAIKATNFLVDKWTRSEVICLRRFLGDLSQLSLSVCPLVFSSGSVFHLRWSICLTRLRYRIKLINVRIDDRGGRPRCLTAVDGRVTVTAAPVTDPTPPTRLRHPADSHDRNDAHP